MAALPLIVFDVNETLLDLETMEPTFQRIERSRERLLVRVAPFAEALGYDDAPVGPLACATEGGSVSMPSCGH